MKWGFLFPALLLLLTSLSGQETAPLFRPKAGGFAIAFPGSPTEQKQVVQTPTGNLNVRQFVLDWKKCRYLVSYSDFPEANLAAGEEEKRLDYARDGLVSRSKGKLASEERIKLSGFPGRDLVIEWDPEMALRCRMLAVKNRLYQTMVLGPRPLVREKSTGDFLESFQLAK